SQIGRRDNAGWINRWLADPHALRPGTAMPRLFGDDATGRAERYAVTAYLVSLGGPMAPAKPARDAREQRKSTETGRALFTSAGCVVCHPAGSDTQPHGEATVYPLGALGSKTTPDALAAYLADPLAVNSHGRMPDMLLRGNEPLDLARFLCQSRDPAISADMPPEPASAEFAAVWRRAIGGNGDPSPRGWRTLGRELAAAKGCVQCHELKAPDVRPAAPGKLDTNRLTAGCLADTAARAGSAPWYGFRPDERAALRDYLATPRPATPSPAPAFAARLALRRFNCVACHQRDGAGGLSPAQLDELRR